MNNELNKAFEQNQSGDKNSLRVYLINPPIDNGWRTQSEYQEEQREARERHAMFVKQHEKLMEQNTLILKSHRAVIASAIFTGIMAFATCITLYFSITKSETQIHQQEITSLQTSISK
jgi:hypothetical protein